MQFELESEFSIGVVQDMIKDDAEVKRHLPNYSQTHRPDKRFLLNIVNTVHEDSISNWVKQVKKLKRAGTRTRLLSGSIQTVALNRMRLPKPFEVKGLLKAVTRSWGYSPTFHYFLYFTSFI